MFERLLIEVDFLNLNIFINCLWLDYQGGSLRLFPNCYRKTHLSLPDHWLAKKYRGSVCISKAHRLFLNAERRLLYSFVYVYWSLQVRSRILALYVEHLHLDFLQHFWVANVPWYFWHCLQLSFGYLFILVTLIIIYYSLDFSQVT